MANGQVKDQPDKPLLVGECCAGWGMPNNQTMIITAVPNIHLL